ncbi:hypothetical protein [Formosa sp. S-31]|uniref:hypothetical protein n=1 Tax=Formosa sp. S-31 TaxID=2790949 RepID=UPI003EBA8F58
MSGQSIEIKGTISGDDDIENIHIINKTSQRFTVSNRFGEFVIEARLNDTIVFSAIQYTTLEVIVNPAIFASKVLDVEMVEHVNTLSEVIVGKVLTGNLFSDVQNSTARPDINFYDVGIQGYMGKQKTQPERRLHEATTGGGIVPLNPIINAITGRTKMLKQHIALERKDDLIHNIKARLSHDFFTEHPLGDTYKMDFYYFCADDPLFMNRCKNKSDIEILIFLNEKYIQYIENQKTD